jgi:CHRD domain
MHLNEDHGRTRVKLGPLAIAVAVVALAVPAALLAGGRSGNLDSRMTGAQVVPHGDGAPRGIGHARFRVRAAQEKLCFDTTFQRTGGAVRGYIFRGRRGEEPPNPQRPTVTLFGSLETSPEAGCARDVKKKKLRRIKDMPRAFHVVLVNNRYDNGAVRGQLRR